MRRDLTNTVILWFCLTIIMEFLAPLMPFPLAAAQEAVASDESFRLLLSLGVPVFTFVIAVMGYSLWKFRATGDAIEDGEPLQENSWVTGTWLAITGSLCLFVIVNPGFTGMAKFAGSQQEDMVIQVVGHQWSWEINYPAQGLYGAQELVLPVRQRVKFNITSADVLHAFWIPAFRNKVDAIPGRLSVMYVTPTKTKSFQDDFNLRIQCTEICGKNHAVMSMPVRVVSEKEFNAWAEAQIALMQNDPISRGMRVAKTQGCSGCHSSDGSEGTGPTWKDLYESQVVLEDGSTVKADEDYLRDSIIDPNAKIVKDFSADTMPQTFGTSLTEEQISDLLTYIASLSPEGNHIEATLSDYQILLSHGAARAGDVTFEIKNVSASIMHEMIIIKTDLTPDQLPLNAEGELDEDKLTEDPAQAMGDMLWKIGALEDIEAGKGGSFTINMPAGHYIMFCNKPGHFKMKMYLEFTVVP